MCVINVTIFVGFITFSVKCIKNCKISTQIEQFVQVSTCKRKTYMWHWYTTKFSQSVQVCSVIRTNPSWFLSFPFSGQWTEKSRLYLWKVAQLYTGVTSRTVYILQVGTLSAYVRTSVLLMFLWGDKHKLTIQLIDSSVFGDSVTVYVIPYLLWGIFQCRTPPPPSRRRSWQTWCPSRQGRRQSPPAAACTGTSVHRTSYNRHRPRQGISYPEQ